MNKLGNLRTTQTSGKFPRAIACVERAMRPRVPFPWDNLAAASCPLFLHKPTKPRTWKKQPEEASFSRKGGVGWGGTGPGLVCLRAEGHWEVTDPQARAGLPGPGTAPANPLGWMAPADCRQEQRWNSSQSEERYPA